MNRRTIKSNPLKYRHVIAHGRFNAFEYQMTAEYRRVYQLVTVILIIAWTIVTLHWFRKGIPAYVLVVWVFSLLITYTVVDYVFYARSQKKN